MFKIQEPENMWRVVLVDSNEIAIETEKFNLWYGDFQALFDVDVQIKKGIITSLIGPSGCGKSTLLRSMNRIIDRLDYVKTTGGIRILGHDIFAPDVELVQLRRNVGMVFQRPNPLPLSIRENILFGPKIHSTKKYSKEEQDEIVENALKTVLLWEKTKDRLHDSAIKLSLEEQQNYVLHDWFLSNQQSY
jgi:phosphate transport system ATP-binding protein